MNIYLVSKQNLHLRHPTASIVTWISLQFSRSDKKLNKHNKINQYHCKTFSGCDSVHGSKMQKQISAPYGEISKQLFSVSGLTLSPNFTNVRQHFSQKLMMINFNNCKTLLWSSSYTLQTFSFHAHRQAFLVAAVLAAITLSLVHNAVLLISASILQLFTHCALEEAFTAFTTVEQTCTSQNYTQ